MVVLSHLGGLVAEVVAVGVVGFQRDGSLATLDFAGPEPRRSLRSWIAVGSPVCPARGATASLRWGEKVSGPCAELLPLGGDVLEHVAAVVGSCGEHGGQAGGARRKCGSRRRTAALTGRNEAGGGRDPVAGCGDFLFSRVKLAEHHPDRSVEVLQRPVRPGQQVTVPDAGHLAHQDDT